MCIRDRERASQLETKAEEDQEKIEQQRKEMLEAYKKTADFEAAIKVCNNTKNELNIVMQSLRNKIQSLEDELQREAKQHAQVRGTLNQVKLKNDDLNQENVKLQKKLRELRQQYDSQVSHSCII